MARHGVAFVGPSLPPGYRPGPGVELRGAARRGDIAQAVQDGFHVIALIDGRLFDVPAVTPEEVEQAARATTVLAGVSMGALRALDCPSTLPVGILAERFLRGELYDEDEVVGTFDPDSQRLLGLPLVVVRDLVERMLGPGEDCDAVVEAVRALPVARRTLSAVARSSGGRLERARLERALADEPDIKQRDAALVLEVLAQAVAQGPGGPWQRRLLDREALRR